HGHACEVPAGGTHRAAVRPGDAEEAVEQRGLTGAVGPDEPDQLPRLDFEVDVVEGDDAGKGLPDASCDEQAHELVLARVRRSSRRCTATSDVRLPCSTMPSGWRAKVSAPSPKSTGCQVSESPIAFNASGNSLSAAPPCTAPSTVRAPSVTTITIQNRPAPTLKSAW